MDKHSITLSLRTFIAIIAVAAVLIVGTVTLVVNWNNWFGAEPVITDKPTPDIDPDAGDWQETLPSDNDGAVKGIKIPDIPRLPLQQTQRMLLWH